MGAYMRSQLASLENHPWVGEIRGKGLLIGIELVADRETKEPLAGEKVGAIKERCLELGTIIRRNGSTIPGLSNVLIIAPPLILTEADADKIINDLKQALN